MNIVDEIDPIMEKLRDQHGQLARKANKWLEARHGLLPFVRDMILIGGDCNYSDDYINLTLCGDKAKFLALVRLVRRYGFKPDMPKEGATMAQWFLQRDGINFFVSFTSTVCKRVQVGTTMQEMPVYETQCESFIPTDDELLRDAKRLVEEGL